MPPAASSIHRGARVEGRYDGEMHARNWETMIRNCVESLVAKTGHHEFTLDDFCAQWRKQISDRYPRRRDVCTAIRRRMSILCSAGVLTRIGKGHYRLNR